MRTIQKSEIGSFDATTAMFNQLALANQTTQQVINSILAMRSWMCFKITVPKPGTIAIIGDAVKFTTFANKQASVQYHHILEVVGVAEGALIVASKLENKCPFSLVGVDHSIAALVHVLEYNIPHSILASDQELNKALGYYIPDNCPQETAQLCADLKLMVSCLIRRCTRNRPIAELNNTQGNTREAKTALFQATIANLITIYLNSTDY